MCHNISSHLVKILHERVVVRAKPNVFLNLFCIWRSEHVCQIFAALIVL